MDDRPFYYRVRGRTLGPIGLRQIRQLAQRAQVGRQTDVSRDGIQWGKAGDWPEIFDAGGRPDSSTAIGLSGGDAGPLVADLAPAAGVAPLWYYSVAGIQKGPVELVTLQQMVATGQLSGADHVFPEGGRDWMPVSNVPQLNVPSGPVAPVINVTVPQSTSPPTEGTNGLAIAGFILALLGCGPLGLILSLVALNSKNKANRGLAIAGAIIGGLLTLCGCGYVVAVIIVAAGNAQ